MLLSIMRIIFQEKLYLYFVHRVYLTLFVFFIFYKIFSVIFAKKFLKHTMKYLFSTLTFISSVLVFSQSISKQVVGSIGATQSKNNIELSFTVGELVVGLMSAGDQQLANGYYAAMNLQTLSLEDNALDVKLSVYPNPTSHALYVNHPDINSFGISMVDLNGKLLYQGTINKDEPLNISNYTTGIYVVIVENTKTKNKNTYKIIKK